MATFFVAPAPFSYARAIRYGLEYPITHLAEVHKFHR